MNMRVMHAVLMVAALFAANGYATTRVEVGYIERVTCPESFTWATNGVVRPVMALMPVHAGDHFAFVAAAQTPECTDPSITVNLGGRPFVLHKGNTPFAVKAGKGRQRTIIENLVSWFGNVTEPNERERVTARARGDDGLAFRVIDETGAKMVAGTRTIRLSWRGGSGPYSVEVRGLAGVLFVKELMVTQTVEIPDRPWEPGEYLIRLSDSTGARVDVPLDVVERTALPTMPPPRAQAIERSGLEGTAKATLIAAWLAYLPGGWAWEGYQQAVALESSYTPARSLREKLEQTTPQDRARESFW